MLYYPDKSISVVPPILPMKSFLQVALNGDRIHTAAPRNLKDLARDAQQSVKAGAQSIHFHPYDLWGKETFDPNQCGQAIRTVREACPGIPLSLSTSATIEADPKARLQLITSWTEMPDLVTANMGEAGILDLCDSLLARGVAIEAGLLCLADALAFIKSGIAPFCHRVMVEPLDIDVDTAVRHAQAIEQVVMKAGIPLPQVHHGYGIACWAVNRQALHRGHGIRTGLEDTDVLPNGHVANSNADLVAMAIELVRQVHEN